MFIKYILCYQPSPVQKTAPEPVAKAPVPDDHKVLQDIFDGLTKQCLAASGNPVSLNSTIHMCLKL